jgi:diguanylate cyclase (GGDEF)-like protein
MEPDSNQGALRSRVLTPLLGLPAGLPQPPLEAETIPTRVLDSTGHRPPVALEQRDELLDERPLLRQMIALLELALDEARRFANHDDVTGLPNRRLLEDRFEQAKARSDRQRQSLAVLFLDLDGFKRINDTHGHAVGDDLLRRFAARLVGCIRTSDTVCRYGGDEFVILLPEIDGRLGAISATQNIREQLSGAYFAGRMSIALPTSVGMALSPTDGTELGGLIEIADSAMYREKVCKRDAQCNPPQNRADSSVTSTVGEAGCPKLTRTLDEANSSFRRACEEDRSTSDSAPPLAVYAPHIGTTERNGK